MGDVRAHFERTADQFDHLYEDSAQNALMRRLNRWLRSDIVQRFALVMRHAQEIGAQSVLDIGCGSGRYLTALAEVGVTRAVGLDISGPMLEMARRRVAALDGCHIDLVESDFLQWASDEQFDLVIAMGYFDYQSDPASHLRKMAAFARQSVIASFPRRHLIRMPIRRLRYLIKRCPVYFFSASQIASLGAAAGFDGSDVAITPKSHASLTAIFKAG
jgi:ubiquinone/menaquinone biosynthesis C-methylase UbiE